MNGVVGAFEVNRVKEGWSCTYCTQEQDAEAELGKVAHSAWRVLDLGEQLERSASPVLYIKKIVGLGA